MKLLVLGGAGYIGSHFVKIALEQNYEIIVLDNLSTGHKSSLPNEVKFYYGDVRDVSLLDTVFSENHIDACIHFCASSLVGESIVEPLKYFDNNVNGTIRLLQTMLKYNVKKVIFSSTAAVYGKREKMPITEDSETSPNNPYGDSKLMMEKMFYWADKAHGIKYISLRYFNVAGAASDGSIGEDHNPETHLIPIILQVPLGKRDFLTIFGNDYKTIDGTCIRDYIHVEDLVDAHLKALDYLERFDQSNVFNLGSQSGYSNLQILESARLITKSDIPAVIGPRRAGDPDKLIASNAKAKKDLDWAPKKGIEDIIESAWKYHKKENDKSGGKKHD